MPVHRVPIDDNLETVIAAIQKGERIVSATSDLYGWLVVITEKARTGKETR